MQSARKKLIFVLKRVFVCSARRQERETVSDREQTERGGSGRRGAARG